ncbi:MAG: hypothetical protein A2506_01420 [Elusimicrobia bacterium RIFOXYD12_FULL_66_9]|nr:MAG: hypothetical protein A2506_01420 [Elusimicrobia bacterium RIFOXYD12_FULL_66_9]
MKKTSLVVFGIALAVRLAYVAAASKGSAERAGDAADYHSYAASLVEHREYRNAEGDRASRMPGYPLALAAQYAAVGRSPLATQLWQSLLGALTCVLIAALAARWVPPPWPLAAGLLAAFSLDLVRPCARLLTEAPAAFFLTLTLWLLADDRLLKTRQAALAGAAAAAAFLVRPELGPWAALAAVHAGWRARTRCAAVLLAAPLAVALAWGTRNALVLGRPVTTTTAGSFNLYGWGIPRTIEERLGGPRWERAPAGTPEIARSEFYTTRARIYFLMEGKAGPLAKALAVNLAVLYYPFDPALDPTFLFLAPLALLGAWSAFKDGRTRLLTYTAAYFTALYMFVGVLIPRHRETYAGVIVLLALIGLERLRAHLGRRRFTFAAGGWAALCATAWACGPWLRTAALALRDALLT